MAFPLSKMGRVSRRGGTLSDLQIKRISRAAVWRQGSKGGSKNPGKVVTVIEVLRGAAWARVLDSSSGGKNWAGFSK